MRRLLTPATLKRHRVDRAARHHFAALGAQARGSETGVLIFVAVDDRQVRILAAPSLHQKTDEAAWSKAANAIGASMKAGHDPTAGIVEAIEIDTAHYKGNYPDSCSILAGDMPRGGDALDQAVITASMFWEELLPQQKLTADAIHKFDKVAARGPVTHIRVNIFPDGGISRLRVYGKLVE